MRLFRFQAALNLLPVFVLTSAPVLADESTPLPPTRAFDIVTVEKLGRAMYAQDQEAWKARDILTAKYSDAELRSEKVHGWIVVTKGNTDVVRFVRSGTNGPEVAYDVPFANGVPSDISAPPDRTLTAEERAQYDARMLALANVKRRCTDMYNTVALRDPQGDGWLVRAMSATKDPNLIVMGGHYRFSISADGKTVQRTDSLSLGCQQFDRARGEEREVSQALEQVVSLTPVETYVFANSSYKIPLVIGTTDNRAWKVDQGMLQEIYDDAPNPDGYAVRWLHGRDEKCVVLLKILGEQPEKYRIGPQTRVIVPTEHDDKFLPAVPTGTAAAAITCIRQAIVPAPNDYKVLLAGIPLSIVDKGTGHPERMSDLEVVKGRIQLRAVSGPSLTEDVAKRVQARLNQLQTAYQSKVTATTSNSPQQNPQ